MSELPSIAIERWNGAAVGDYVQILKPRVMSLVVFTGIVGLLLAPGHLHPVLAAVAVLCIAIGAGAAGAINMWYDRDIDAVMRRTPQNIVIGGAAGALPPLIGWAAVTGDVGWGALALFAIIFFWTPPHFWALSLYRAGEYEAAGIPMLPVVAGPRETKRQMLLYTLMLWPTTAAPWLLGVVGPLYGVGAGVLSLAFTATAVRVWRDPTDRSARQMFAFSLLYLFLIFTLLLVDRIGGGLR